MAELLMGARFWHQASGLFFHRESPEIEVRRQQGVTRGPDCGGGRAGSETT